MGADASAREQTKVCVAERDGRRVDLLSLVK